MKLSACGPLHANLCETRIRRETGRFAKNAKSDAALSSYTPRRSAYYAFMKEPRQATARTPLSKQLLIAAQSLAGRGDDFR